MKQNCLFMSTLLIFSTYNQAAEHAAIGHHKTTIISQEEAEQLITAFENDLFSYDPLKKMANYASLNRIAPPKVCSVGVVLNQDGPIHFVLDSPLVKEVYKLAPVEAYCDAQGKPEIKAYLEQLRLLATLFFLLSLPEPILQQMFFIPSTWVNQHPYPFAQETLELFKSIAHRTCIQALHDLKDSAQNAGMKKPHNITKIFGSIKYERLSPQDQNLYHHVGADDITQTITSLTKACDDFETDLTKTQ